MDTMSYKTVSANIETANKDWILINAEGQTLGRIASVIAKRLRGKHKTNFTPHVDCGDNVVVINAEKIKLSGKKWADKEYVHYTGYQGGKKVIKARDVYRRHPERILEKAVQGMLPKNRLGSKLFNNLKLNVGAEHNQQAQKPKEIKIDSIR